MDSSPYRIAGAKYLSEKTGTIDQVLWSAQSRPHKVVSVLSFTDGEELASIAVDDSMLPYLQPGRSGTFGFMSAGAYGVLIRMGEATADSSAWRRFALAKWFQAAMLLVVAAGLLALAVFTSNVFLGVVVLPVVIAALEATRSGVYLQRAAGVANMRTIVLLAVAAWIAFLWLGWLVALAIMA